MTKAPRIQIFKGPELVFLRIDGVEYKIIPDVAAMVGETLFKTAWDVRARMESEKEKQ